MDKIEQLYNLYKERGLITDAVPLETFRAASGDQISQLYNIGKDNGLFETTDEGTFSTAWGTGTEEVTEEVTAEEPKKEQAVSTESPLDSAQESSTLDTIEEKETQTVEQESSSQDIEEPNEEVAALYDQYKEQGLITEPQQKAIDSQLSKEAAGERSTWENIDAYATGMLKTGFLIPAYKYHTEEELTAQRIQKNKVNFLEALPKEKVQELNEYAVNRTIALSKENQNIMAEIAMQKEKGKSLEKSLEQMGAAINQLAEAGEVIPQEGIDAYEAKYEEMQNLIVANDNSVNLIESNEDDIGEFGEELDLLKKNFGGLEYYKDLTRLSTAGLIAGVMDMAVTATALRAPMGAPSHPEAEKWVGEFRDEVSAQREMIKDPMSVNDIEGGLDLGKWLLEVTATQLPILTVIAASGGSAGLGAISVASGGQKIGEMKDSNKAGKTNYDSGTMLMAGIGAAGVEFASESVTLGLLSKGRRALFSGMSNPATARNIRKGFADNFSAMYKEGGSEFGAAVGNNVIDILLLGKKDVHILDHTVDALAAGAAMGSGMHAFPTLTGYMARSFMNKKKSKKVRDNSLRMEAIANELENNKDLSEESKKFMQDKIDNLTEENSEEFRKVFGDISELGEESIQKLIELDKKGEEIREEVKKIEDSDLSPEMKTELKQHNKLKIDAVVEEKEVLLNKGETRVAKDVVNRPVTVTKLGGSKLDAPIQGDLYIEGQTLVLEKKNGDVIELGNAENLSEENINELGIEVDADVIKVNNNGSITVEGNTWNIQRDLPTRGVETDANGEVKSVSLKDNTGKTVQYTGKVAEDLAYQIKLDEKNGTEFKEKAVVDTKAEVSARAKAQEKRANERAKREARLREKDAAESSVARDGESVQSDSVGDKGKAPTIKEFSKIDLSDQIGINKVLETLDTWEKNLKEGTKDTLGVNLPVAAAQIAITAMRVAAKTAKTGADVLSAGLNAVQKSDWYLGQGASVRKDIDENFATRLAEAGKEAELAEQVTKPSKVKKKKVKAKTQIRKSTGQTDTSNKVVTTERKALRDKLKVEAKASLKGYRAGKVSLQSAKKSLSDLIAKYVKDSSGIYTKGEVKRLLSKVKKVTEKNFEAVAEETVNYIKDHLETRQDKSKIRGLKSKAKKKDKKSIKAPDNLKKLARQATYINEQFLPAKELKQYRAILGGILGALAGVTAKNYSPINVHETYEKLEKIQNVANETYLAHLKAEVVEDIVEMTEEEIEMHLFDLAKEKKDALREKLEEMAEERLYILDRIEVDLFTDKQKRWVRDMGAVNFDLLGIPALKEYVRAADNIIVNGDFSGVYSNIISKIRSAKAAQEFLKEIGKSKLGSKAIRLVRDNGVTSAKDVSLVFKQMFGGTAMAAAFNLASGFAKLSKQYELSKRNAALLEKRYEKVVKAIRKKHPNINKAYNVIARGVYANLIQGSTAEDFKINKARIESTIKNQKSSYKTKEQAKHAEQIYDEVKHLKSQQEVLDYLDKKKDGNAEVLDFWMREFHEIKEALKDNTEQVFGERFNIILDNFLPIGVLRSETILAREELERPSIAGGLPNPQRSPTTMSRVKSPNLPKDYALNLDFDSVMFDKYEKSIYDIHVSEAGFDIRNFFHVPEIKEALGKDNVDLMTKTVNRALSIQKNLIQYDRSHLGKALRKTAGFVKKIAAVQALGSIYAYPKQFVGVVVNAGVRLGADAGLLFDSVSDFATHGAIEIVEQSLARRGQIEGGTRQAYERPSTAERKAVRAYAGTLSKQLGLKADEVRHMLFASLRTGDTHAAKVTWLAYYKKYLKDNSKYDISELDMSQEHLLIEGDKVRQEAASYAAQNVEETQIATDESRESQLYSKDSSTAIQVFKDLALPYSRFVIQAKLRMMVDVTNALRSAKAGDMEGARNSAASLIGTIAEQTVFHGINYFILKPGIVTIASLIKAALGGDDEEVEIDWGFKFNQFYSKLFTDVIPFAIGQGMENGLIEIANFVEYAIMSEDAKKFSSQEEYEKFLREIGKMKALYRYGDKDGFELGWEGLGVYQGALDVAGDLMDTRKYAFDDVATTEGFYGNDKNVVIQDRDKDFMKVMFVFELASSMGLMEAETYRALKREQRKRLKRAIKVTKN